MPRNNYGDLSEKANKQVQGKICNFTVNRDHSYKEQGNKGGHLHYGWEIKSIMRLIIIVSEHRNVDM